MTDLLVSVVQSRLHWESISKNINMFSTYLKKFEVKPDLIIFPELFTTGFTMNVKECSESMTGKAIGFLKENSKKKDASLCGSIILKAGRKYYNRLLVCSPKGEIKFYDKRHLFRMAGENKIYSPGNKKLIIKIKDWRVAFFICYDLRFPVWCRNRNDYDAAVYIANWPERRAFHWKTLLLSRAIENQTYVIGVNRIGKDGNDINYIGDSAVVNPLGEYLLDAKNKSGIFSAVMEKKKLVNYRTKFPVYMDADKFTIK